MSTIAQRYERLRAEVPPHVSIVAVTKFHPVEDVLEALEAGVTDVGENYVQEARAKFTGVEALERVRKHFIGHVQTNKAKAIAQTFDVVQSVDRLDAGTALAKAAANLGMRLGVLLQVNISPSERFGCPPDEAEHLAERLRSFQSLDLQGVMAIGPITRDEAELASAFATAAQIRERIGARVLSIGMSGDWEQAVRAGSTMIRIGSAIFGPRPARPASKNAVM